MKIRLIITIFLISTITIFGQEKSRQRGNLQVSVYNVDDREPLPAANIILDGTTIGGITDENGKLSLSDVPVGVYVIRVSIIGFTPSVTSDIVITSSKPMVLEIPLSPVDISVGEVSVIADYFQKSPDAYLSTQRQSYEEIRQLPGGLEDVVRAISILPGVAQVQAGRNDLIVRGGAPSENLFLIDNLEVPNINHFGTQGASGGPLSFVNLDFVRGTTFSSGGFGVRYGDKLSSVLAIDLRNGRTDRLGGKATISASQFGLNLEGPLNENGSYLFSARRSYLDFIFKAAGFSFVPEYWDFLGKADYKLDEKNRLSLLSIAVLDGTKFFNDTPDKRYNNSRILGSNQDQYIWGLSWQRFFSSGYTTVTGGFRTVQFMYRQQDSLEQEIFSNRSRENETSLSTDLVMKLSPLAELSAGIQAKAVHSTTDMILTQFQSRFGQQLSSNGYDELTAIKGATFTQVSFRLPQVTITAGGRVEYFSGIAENIKISPRVAASFHPFSKTTFNMSVGKYYQSPSYIWLMGNPANSSLTPISANQFILGVEHLLRDDTKLTLEGYLKTYDRYPVSIVRPYLTMANTGAGFGGADEGFASFGTDSLVSRGTGNAHGIEFLAQKKFSEIPCYGTISISYNETQFTPLDGTSRPGSFDQRWILNIGGGYVFNEEWESSMKFRLATGRPYTPFNSDGTQSGSRYNTERLGTNHSLDVRVDRRWLYDTWTLIVYIDIQNVYNKKPNDVPRYDSRTKTIKTNQSIGILPSIGVSAEF